MKKIYVLILAVCFAAATEAQVFTENFDGAWTSPAPSGWTSAQGTANMQWHRNDYTTGWSFPSSGSPSATGAQSTTYYARFHSYGISSGNSDLTSPSISLAGASSGSLDFYYINPSGSDNLNVFFSNDGGTTWSASQGNYIVQAGWGLKTISIPVAYLVGNFKMRFVATSDYGNDDIGLDQISVTAALPACSGTPAPGNTVASVNPVCPTANFTLTLQNSTSGSGVTYQWQSADDAAFSVGLTNLGTSSSQSTSQTTAKYYRCLVTCTNSGMATYSTPVQVTMNPISNCYCTPTTSGGNTWYVTNFTTTGAATNINNTSGGSATGYQDFFATQSMTAAQGSAFNYSINAPAGDTYGYGMWIDYNQNGTFEPSEQVVSTSSYTNPPKTGTINIPGTATLGTTRLRIVATFTPNNPSNPCVNSGSGEYEDYKITFFAAPPPNDACANAIPIACGQSINGTTTNGTPDAVTGCATTLNSAPGVWYSMVGDGSPVTMSLCGSGFDTKIGVFTGTCAALTCVGSNDDFCGLQSQVTFNTVSGTTYYILVTGFGSSNGAFTLVRNCAPACSGVPSPGSITPTTSSVCTGSSVTLTVSGYSAATGLTFQWRSAPAAGGPYTNIAGATSNVYTFNATATAYYTCVVTCTNGNGSGTTAAVVVNVSNISHSSLVATPSTVCSPGSVVITATATGGIGNYTHTLSGPGTIGAAVPSGPNNSNVSFTVTNIPAGVQTYTITSTDGIPCSKSSNVSVTVNPTPVVTLTPAAPVICAGAIQTITASSTPSSTVVFSPVTGLYTDAGATVPYTGTAVNTVYAKPATTTTYTATAVVNSCTGSNTVTVTVNQLPAIVTNPSPASQMICPGFNVTYTVSASGTGPLTYQWRRNGVAIANNSQIFGATSPTLTIFNVALANAGNYDCVVSGVCPPAATSAIAILQVASAPTITTHPANATVCTAPSTNLVSATFNVVAAGSPTPNIFQWQISTDGGATWNNLANTPSTSSPFYNGVFSSSLSVANAPVSLNGARFRLVVTNSCGQNVTSNSATLTVNATTPTTVTDLSTNRICLSDSLVGLTGLPVGGSWSGIGVSGFNFVPAATGIGTYTLTYSFTNSAGCNAKSSTVVAVSDCPERLRLLRDDAVSIYPNPSNGQFNIRINSTLYKSLGMKVFDMNGRLMNGKIVKNNLDKQLVSPVYSNLVYGRVIPVDLTGLANGTYLVELYYDDGIRTEKKGFLIQILK